ncbi:ferric reductase-like transmembrane domain-containing protein [Myxococcota bacterium]|nr:ferric reductase-like transmembrane domain-containing protein [Myxococcota bacterium]
MSTPERSVPTPRDAPTRLAPSTLAAVAAVAALVITGAEAARAPIAITRELILSRGTGWSSLVLLAASLAITPLTRVSPDHARVLAPHRRTLGLASATLAAVHLAIVLATGLVPDVVLLVVEPQARAGTVAGVILVLLAVTSSGRVVRALALRPWRELHALTYAAALFALLHVALSPWPDVRLVAAAALIVGALLASRLVVRRR